MSKPGRIYCFKNLVNGKMYIGKTVSPEGTSLSRERFHVCAARGGKTDLPAFYGALRKYGESNFSCEILFRSENPAELAAEEIRLIALLGSEQPGGYNLTSGGDGIQNMTQSIRDKISAKNRGRKQSLSEKMMRREVQARIISQRGTDPHPNEGKILSKETRAKISLGNSGKAKPKSPEHRAKLALITGSAASAFGKRWVTNPRTQEMKLVARSVAEECVAAGWVYGLNAATRAACGQRGRNGK